MSCLALVALAAAHADPSPRTLELRLAETIPYCGGAAPTPEVEAAHALPRPLSGQAFLVRPGATNTDAAAVEVRLDARGEARLSLAPGDHCLVTPDKRQVPLPPGAPVPPQHDAACLARLRETCDLVLRVEAGPGPQRWEHVFHRPCFWMPPPCFTGPPPSPPPSAAPGS